MELTLTEAAAAPSIARVEDHWSNWLLGGALVAGGIAALVSPIHTLARLGECDDRAGLPSGWCRHRVSFGAQSTVLLSVGVAALIGGVATLAARPIRVTTVITPDSASLQLSGTF